MSDNDKIEIAKIATQLTIAILKEDGLERKRAAKYPKSEDDKDDHRPNTLKIFDGVYKHVQSVLTEQ